MTDAGSTNRARPRHKRAPASADPIDIAMEAEASGEPVGGEAALLLRDQRRLINADLKHRGWQIASERVGFALKILTGLAGVAVATALGLMVWSAAHADGVILEPFKVPPALAAEGVSGEVVAGQVLDELARLRVETLAPGEARDYGDDWGRSIKLSIPTTGVSLGDLQEALRQWLGHETDISGEVYRTPTGMALRARVPGRPGLKVDGPADALEVSAQTLARQIYRDTQPLRYAFWLDSHDDHAGATQIAQPIAIAGRSPADKATAYGVLSSARNGLGDAAGAIAMAQEGLRIAPDRSALWNGLAINEGNQGHWENAIRAYRKLIEVLPKDRAVSPEWRDVSITRGKLADLLADYPESRRQYRAAEGVPNAVQVEAVQLDTFPARAMARMHDIAAATARLDHPRFAISWQAAHNEHQLLMHRVTKA